MPARCPSLLGPSGRLLVSDFRQCVANVTFYAMFMRSFVEIFVEHTTGEQEAILIRRGAPKPVDDSTPHNLPYASYKVYRRNAHLWLGMNLPV